MLFYGYRNHGGNLANPVTSPRGNHGNPQLIEEAKMIALAVYVGVVVLSVFSTIFNGYVLSVLWGWFIVPTFGMPALGLVPAIGVAMVVQYLTHQNHHCKEEEMTFGKTVLKEIMMVVLVPSLTLFFGYIVHLFM